MLLNPNPTTPTLVPNTNLYQKFTYVLLLISSSTIGKVNVNAQLYADEASYFSGTSSQFCNLGTIDFNINSAGLSEAATTFATTLFPNFTYVSPPVAPVVTPPVSSGSGSSNHTI